MLSRRSFIAGSLGFTLSLESIAEALAKKTKARVLTYSGPHSLVRQEWPPAIAPEFLSIVDKGNCLFANQNGHLAIVDLKQEDGPKILNELFGLGKKVIDLVTTENKAYALVLSESGNESQYILATINLHPADQLAIVAQTPLTNFSEPSCLAINRDIICIGGLGFNGENQVLVFSANSKKKNTELNLLSTTSFPHPIAKIDLQEKQLLVIQNSSNTHVDLLNLNNPHLPETISTNTYKGSFVSAVRQKDSLIIINETANNTYSCRSILIKHSLNLVNSVVLSNVTSVFDLIATREQFLALAIQSGKQVIIPVNCSKEKEISAAGAIILQAGKHGATTKAKIISFNKQVYVASDSGVVQILSIEKNNWQYLYSYTIPRLPAAAIAMSNNKVVLAGADLKLYDYISPNKTLLVNETEVGSPIRSIIALNNCVLCLERSRLTLRSLEKLSEIRSSVAITGTLLAYDSTLHKAYVINSQEKNTKLTSFAVSDDSLVLETTETIDVQIRRAHAANGKLLLAGLNELLLYKAEKQFELIGKRELGNLAIRDLSLESNYAAIACLTKASRGYLLIVSTDKYELTTLGAIDLPQDANALALTNKLAVIVGKNPDGKDYASIVNLENLAQPKTVTSIPVLDAASAVAIKDKLAAVAGRGLEIISLI